MDSKTQNDDFLENGFSSFGYISNIYGDHIHKLNYIGGMFRGITFHKLTARTRNIHFVETCFTGQTEFIFVRYSAT
jgi:hypothetical protein